eukprot:TRINITY_DN4563_c0_g1_i1.p1 TRINITY_DN4563_c0_g1~~TRINITY_DN4563_c0_g1_i1.p1  ORF type:complete len:1106 (-),score=187.38 TRINITY_DN4563_c0_g1_i1:118-3435(-)
MESLDYCKQTKRVLIMITLMTLFVFELVIISGDVYSDAYDFQLRATKTVDQGVDLYQQGGFIDLHRANFSMRLYVDNATMRELRAESHFINPDGSWRNYTELFFTSDDYLLHNVSLPTPPFDQNSTSQGPSVYLEIMSSQLDANGAIVGMNNLKIETPSWFSTTTTSILRNSFNSPFKCRSEGGYYDMDKMICTTFEIIQEICVTVKLNKGTNQWDLVSYENQTGYATCYYPFESWGFYLPLIYEDYYNASSATQNSSFTIQPKLRVVVRSVEDPFVIGESLFEGKSFTDFYYNKLIGGRDPLIMASLVCAILILLVTLYSFLRPSTWTPPQFDLLRDNARSRKPMPLHFVMWGSSLLLLAVGLFVAPHLVGFTYQWNQPNTSTSNSFYGAVLMTSTLITGLVLFTWGLGVSIRSITARKRIVLLLVTNLVICLAIVAWTIIGLVKPWLNVFPEIGRPDSFQRLIGMLVAMVMTALSIVIAFILRRETRPVLSGDKQRLLAQHEHENRASKIGKIVISVLVIPVTLIATMVFPPSWTIPLLGDGGYPVYASHQSRYALLTIYFSEDFNVKLYSSVAIFYGAIVVLVAARFFNHIVSVSRHMNVRIRWINGLPVKHSILAVLCALLFGVWIWYWGFHYVDIAQLEPVERIARVLGHLSNLSVTLTLMAILHEAPWKAQFTTGVVWHKILGIFSFVIITLHMLFWWLKFWTNGTLVQNSLGFHYSEDPDNWTIPFVEAAWAIFCIDMLLSHPWFRKHNFEMFSLMHLISFLSLISASLIHAWSFWYIAGVALALIFLEQCFRFYRSTKNYKVYSAQIYENDHGAYIVLQVARQSLTIGAGQYVYVNIPSVASLQWHPLTAVNAPHENTLTFLIRDMGPGTWSNGVHKAITAGKFGIPKELQLSVDVEHADNAQIVRQNQSISPQQNGARTTFTMCLDGPYGDIMKYEHNVYVLIAGGIGITPLVSLYRQLYHLIRARDPTVLHVKKIYLVWTVKYLAILQPFIQKLNEIMSDEHVNTVFAKVSLYVTNTRIEEQQNLDLLNPNDNTVQVDFARVNLNWEFAKIAEEHHADVLQNQVVAIVCGPKSLRRDVSKNCFKHNFVYREEMYH